MRAGGRAAADVLLLSCGDAWLDAAIQLFWSFKNLSHVLCYLDWISALLHRCITAYGSIKTHHRIMMTLYQSAKSN